jgi:hypothetical protein
MAKGKKNALVKVEKNPLMKIDKNPLMKKEDPEPIEGDLCFILRLSHPLCEISKFLDPNAVDTEMFWERLDPPVGLVESLGIIQCGFATDVNFRPGDLFHEPYAYAHKAFRVYDSAGLINPVIWRMFSSHWFEPGYDPAVEATQFALNIKDADVKATIVFDDQALFDAFYEGYRIFIVPDCSYSQGRQWLYYTADSETYPQYGRYDGKMPLGEYTFKCEDPEGNAYHAVTFTPETITVTYDYKPTVPLEINFGIEPVDNIYTMTIRRKEVLLIMEYVEDNCPVYNYEDLEWEIVIDGKDLGNLDCTSVFGIVVFKEAGTHIFCMGEICRTAYVDARTEKLWFNKELHPIQLYLDIAINSEHAWNDEIKEIRLNVGYRCPRAGVNKTFIENYRIYNLNYKPIIDLNSIIELYEVTPYRGWYEIELVFIFVSSAKIIKRTLEHQVLVNKYTFEFFFNTEEIYGNSLPCQLSFPFSEISQTVPQYNSATSYKKYNKVERPYQNFGKTEFDELNLDTYEYKITTIDKDNKYGEDNILLQLPLPLGDNNCSCADPYVTLGAILPNSLVSVSADVFSSVPGSMYQVIVNFIERDHAKTPEYTYKSQILDAYTDSLLNYSFISPKFHANAYEKYYYTITVERVEDITNNVSSKSNEIWYIRKLALYPTIPREFIHNCAWNDRCPYLTIDGYDSSIFGINKRDFIIDKPANQLLASINSQSFDSNLMDGSINTIDKYEDIELVIPIIFKMSDVTFQQQMSILNYIITRYLKNDRKNNVFRPHILKFSFDDYFYEAILSDEIEPEIDDDNIQKFTFDLKYTINPTKKYKNYMEIGDWDVEQNRMIMIGEVPLNTYISPLFIFITDHFDHKDSVVSIKIEEVMSNQVFMIHGYVTKDEIDVLTPGREFIIDMSTKRIWMDKREITLDLPLIIGDIKLKNSYDLQFNVKHFSTIVYGKQYYDL